MTARLIRRLCRAATLLLPVLALQAEAQTFAIRDATIHTMGPEGTMRDAIVLVKNGKISALGYDESLADGVRVIDGKGKIVTPGLIDAYSQLGTVEIGAVAGSVDHLQRGDDVTASFDIASAINPRSTLIGVNRIDGLTRAAVMPTARSGDTNGERSQILSGLGALIDLSGGDQFLMKNRAALVVQLGSGGGALAGGSRAQAFEQLRRAFDDAIDYRDNRAAFEKGERRDYSLSHEDLQALLPVLDRKIPLVANLHRASDISAAIGMAATYRIRLVVAGATEGWMVADELAASDTAVILHPLANLPEDFDRLNATLENAARLYDAGVTIAFSEFASHNARNLTQSAGNAVAHGLPWMAGLLAITGNPAKIYGIDERLGSIEPGREADLVIWDGDPLELTSAPEQVFIAGVPVPMVSRQTMLRDRYLQDPGEWPRAYLKPWLTGPAR